MSYNNGSGGTLTLPSPTHVHHVDISSHVRSLRRSLSRSPSKFRLVARKSPSPSPKSPLSPSPLSPSPNRRASSTPANNPSPLVPFPPSAKLSLRSASTSHTRSISKSPRVPLRPRSNTRTSPKSPIKRPLSRTSENGNAARRSPTSPATGQENRRSESLSPLEEYERNTKNAQFNLEISAPVNMAILRLGADGANDAFNNTSSPLKRSDAIMNLDQASLGSPVAKRRSLHGSAAWCQDFNVLDQPPAGSFDIHDDQNQEYELSNSALSSANLDANLFQMPRRSSSLRKSTLQQRHGDKTSWGRRHAAQQAAAQAAQFQSGVPEVSTPVSNKNRPRLSLDQFLPPMPRESPFTSQGSLPNASVHMINQQPAAPPQPHPLSRTMTQSSSNSSLVEESPTHVPVNFGQRPKPKVDFSKSLPISAVRPERRNAIVREESGEISTPNNFKSARPLVSAFMSTGLISKVNRNPEELQMPRGGKGAMPDTPCKKQYNAFAFATYPNNQPGSPYAKAKHIRHSFGTPSTPFNPAQSQQGTFGKGRSIFGSGFGAPRRNSLLSNDGSDSGSSPEQNKGSPTAMDFDLPPTPTKQVSTANLPSSRILRGAGGPFSLNRLPPSSAFGSNLGQNVPRSSTSPLERIDYIERMSPRERVPHTPRESLTPPDPSSLSISNKNGSDNNQNLSSSPSSMHLPVTPSGHHGRLGFSYGGKPPSVTPVHQPKAPAIDGCLAAKFERVEAIGMGEFSEVYRVTQHPTPQPAPDQTYYFGAPKSDGFRKSPSTPISDRVFAVKKARNPYKGNKDRLRKLREVEVLKALGKSDHIIGFKDSWEEQGYLYIQTELCEEGGLDHFLAKTGRRGRLDDFRIWKILLEIGLGIKFMHDAGFVHLDLKPANVFITFEGVLKIGDFGMATAVPVPKDTEMEGDREYMAPEALDGKAGMPADVYSLGLIMIEIAANVALPDNGPTWSRLRSGNFEDVPALTNSSLSSVERDSEGLPVDYSDEHLPVYTSDDEMSDFESPNLSQKKRLSMPSIPRSSSHSSGNLYSSLRKASLVRSEHFLGHAPDFMVDTFHEHSLDTIVKSMLAEHPEDRPTIHQALEMQGLRWVAARRRAGATIYEGSWGPSVEVEIHDDGDSLMTGV